MGQVAPIPGKAPGNTCPPHEWAWLAVGVCPWEEKGTKGSPAVSSVPAMVLDTGHGRADGSPCSRELEDAGKEPEQKHELSQKCSPGESL